jgi:hypothetical protein
VEILGDESPEALEIEWLLAGRRALEVVWPVIGLREKVEVD